MSKAKGSRAKRPVAVAIGGFKAANDLPAFFIAGTCVLESASLLARVGRDLKRTFKEAGLNWVLKCSFDKANRSDISSFRGPGLSGALEVFARIKRDLGVPFLTDIHQPGQAEAVARVADVLQIPAFLCRQTDLLVAAGKTGRVVNVKKGQFLAPWDMANAVRKIESTGNRKILLTERGSSFGYGNLVVDMRSLRIMAETGYPVVFDATHSCQLPGSRGTSTGGDSSFAAPLARSAAAMGVAGVFLETHPRPENALSDGPNSIRLRDVKKMVEGVQAIDALAKRARR